MTISLNEEFLGIDTDIVLPNIQSCMAVCVASTGGTLAAMHMTVMTSEEALAAAGRVLSLLMVGNTASLVCVGNANAFKSTLDPKMVFPGSLRLALKTAFGFAGNVLYHSTSSAFAQVTGPKGMVVQTWRDANTNAVRYALGGPTTWTKLPAAVTTARVFRVEEGDFFADDKVGTPFHKRSIIEKTGKPIQVTQLNATLAVLTAQDFSTM